MEWYLWVLLVGVYLIMVVLILIFFHGANIRDVDPPKEIVREDEFGRRI